MPGFNMEKHNKILGIELLKFLAAVFITNSHFKNLYIDPFTPLGTFGAPGNALFFFVSGYTLMLGRKGCFSEWYKRRIRRIWPSIIAWSTFVAPIFFRQPLSWRDIWLAGDFWFIHCIIIYYAIFYFLMPYIHKRIKLLIGISILVAVVYFFMMPVTPFSIYLESFHYVCFGGIMLMGGYCATQIGKSARYSSSRYVLKALAMLVLFYGIQMIGKGKDGIRYYTQIVSLLPLYGFIYYIYMSSLGSWVVRLLECKVIGKAIRFVAALTLEIYLVGFILCYCMMGFNDLFPLNLLMAFAAIVFVAYGVRIVANFILQTFKDSPYEWKIIIKIV